MNHQVRYLPVLANSTLEDYVLVQFFQWQWCPLEIETRFGFRRNNGLFHVHDAGENLLGRLLSGRGSLTILQRPVLPSSRQKYGVDLSATQRTVNAKSAATHRACSN